MRLQVLHLPAPENEFPFALVIDQCADLSDLGSLENITAAAKDALGASGVLVFQEEVEIA